MHGQVDLVLKMHLTSNYFSGPRSDRNHSPPRTSNAPEAHIHQQGAFPCETHDFGRD